MNPKLLVLLLAIGTFGVGLLTAQTESPTPEASASPAKHKSHKKADATAAESPAASPAADSSASPEPKKRSHKAKAGESASPAADASASPAAKRTKKSKAKEEASPAMTASPTATPGSKNPFGNLFKSKKTSSTAAAGASSAAGGTTAAGTTAAGASETVAKTAPEPGGGHGLVWVNTETKVYHKEGSRYYGRTKKGKYMTEGEAMKAGARSAKGGEEKKDMDKAH
jgi:hypothetical protein